MHPYTESCWRTVSQFKGFGEMARAMICPAQFEVSLPISRAAWTMCVHEYRNPFVEGGEPCLMPVDAHLPGKAMVLVAPFDEKTENCFVLFATSDNGVSVWQAFPNAYPVHIGGYWPGTDRVATGSEPWAADLADDDVALRLHHIAMIVSLINTPRLTQRSEVAPSRALRRRMERSASQPAAAFFRVCWTIGKPVKARGSRNSSGKPRMPLHWCRAHWRQTEVGKPSAVWNDERKGWYVWVTDCWKGHPDNGIRLHHYHPRWVDEEQRPGALIPTAKSVDVINACRRSAIEQAGFAA